MKVFIELEVPDKGVTKEELVALIKRQENYTIRTEQDLGISATLEQTETVYPINEIVLKKLYHLGGDAIEYPRSHRKDEEYQSLPGTGNALVGLAYILDGSI